MSDIIERNRQLLESHELSDITFLFKKQDQELPEKIYAHKLELAKGSSVFKTIFYKTSPTITELTIDDFSRESFMEMIKFLYLEETNVTAENALEIFKLSKEYKIDGLEQVYTNFITQDLDVNNVCKLLEDSLLHKNTSLKYKCVNFIERHIVDVLQHTTIVDVNKETLSIILDINSKKCSTTIIYFNTAVRWAKNQCKITEIELSAENMREILGELFYLIAFPSMNFEDFVKCLDEDKLFSDEEIGKIFLYIQLKKKREMKFKFHQENCIVGDTSYMLELENNMNGFLKRDTEYTIKLSVNKSIFLHELFADRNPSGSVTIKREIKTDENKTIFNGNMVTGTLKIMPAIEIQPNYVHQIIIKTTTESAGSVIGHKINYLNDLVIKIFGSLNERSPINKLFFSW